MRARVGAGLGLALMHAPVTQAHHSNVTWIRGNQGGHRHWRGQGIPVAEPAHLAHADRRRCQGQERGLGDRRARPGVLLRADWARDSFKPGETVTVNMSPAKDGTNTGLIARVTKANGTILPNSPPPTE